MKAFKRSAGSILLGVFGLGLAIFAGCSRPLSVAPVPPYIYTRTFTATSTPTLGATATSTPTRITMTLTTGPVFPANSTQPAGTNAIPVMQLNVSNPATGAATLTSLTLTAAGSGNDATGIPSVKLYLDANSNGIVDGGDTLLGNSTFSGDNGTVNLTVGLLFSPSSSANLLVTYDLSGTAPVGTYQPILATNTSLNGTDGSGQPLNFTGAPVNGAVITVASPTLTPTPTNTGAPTSTSTATLTRTNTGAPTATRTNTIPPPPATNTSTLTRTNTLVPSTSTSTRTSTNLPPTATSTLTRTNTVAAATSTPTRTATATPTECDAPSLSLSYNFDSGNIDCWRVDSYPSFPAWVTTVDLSGTQTHNGSAAMRVAVNNTDTAVHNVNLEIKFANAQDLTGATITFWLWVDSSLVDPGYSTGTIDFNFSPTNGSWNGEPWNTLAPAAGGVWNQHTITLPIGSEDVTQVYGFGVMVGNIPAGAAGNIYLDQVQITLPGPTPTQTDTLVPTDTPTFTDTETPTETDTPTDTPAIPVDTDTPTSTPTNTVCVPSVQSSYTFESSDECFKAWAGPGNVALSLDTNTANTHNASAGSLMVTGTYTNEQVIIGLDFPSPATIPMGSIVSLYYKVSTGTGNAQMFHQSPGWNNGTWQNSLPTTWTQLSFTMTGGTTGQTNQVGIQVLNLNGAVTIWIDDVTISAPATPTPTVASDCNPLINGAESMTDNGTWSSVNATLSLGPTGATQGSSALDLNVTVPGADWTNGVLKLAGFAPALWANAVTLQMDVTMDSDIFVSGGYWGQLRLMGDFNGGPYYQQLSPGDLGLVQGTQTLNFPLSNANLATTALNDIFLILNNGGGLGHMHIDNVRLVYSPCPPTPIYSWKFEAGMEGWASGNWLNGGAGETVSQVSPGMAGSSGALNGYIPFANTGDQEVLAYTFPSDVDLTGKTIQADIWIDSAINPLGYPSGFIFVQSGTWVFENGPGGWNNLNKDGWTRLTFTPTYGGAGASSTAVKQIGIQINIGTANPAAAAGNIKVDNVIIY